MFYYLAIYFKLHVFRITLLVQCRSLDYFLNLEIYKYLLLLGGLETIYLPNGSNYFINYSHFGTNKKDELLNIFI